MSRPMSRRALITTGLAAAGASSLGIAAHLMRKFDLVPPDDRGIYGPSNTLTYAAQRLLMLHHPLAREFSPDQISKVAPVKGNPPSNEAYQQLLRGGFADWRLTVDGMVARPASLSLSDLKRLPWCKQVTLHACEAGWSYIAEWTGVRLSEVLSRAGVHPQARYIYVRSFDTVWDTMDMFDAWHPQTLLAYGMNGQDLPAGHGAPVRLRVARQLGYKNVKFLSHLVLTDNAKQYGKGLGGKAPEGGWAWYAGI